MSSKKSTSKGRVFISALLRIIGIIIIVAVAVTALALTVPRLFGLEIYNVESGSMAPEIPTDSVIYVSSVEPEDVKKDDIITFKSVEGTITHRVLENRRVEGEFITKGDANEKEDLTPAQYRDLIGKVAYHFPVLGRLFTIYSSTIGKVYVLLFAAIGVMLNILGSMIRTK